MYEMKIKKNGDAGRRDTKKKNAENIRKKSPQKIICSLFKKKIRVNPSRTLAADILPQSDLLLRGGRGDISRGYPVCVYFNYEAWLK